MKQGPSEACACFLSQSHANANAHVIWSFLRLPFQFRLTLTHTPSIYLYHPHPCHLLSERSQHTHPAATHVLFETCLHWGTTRVVHNPVSASPWHHLVGCAAAHEYVPYCDTRLHPSLLRLCHMLVYRQ